MRFSWVSLFLAAAYGATVLQYADVLNLPKPAAGRRIAYGKLPDQFGDLRLPPGAGPYPVVVVIHGGCWREDFHLDYMAPLAEALTKDGFATWNIEFRRMGQTGGGWPGTYDDALAAVDYLRIVAKESRLDLRRVAILGHSGGGQIALWAGSKRPDFVRGVVSLSGITDLRAAASSLCSGIIPSVVGDDRNYAKVSPIELLPLRVPQWIVTPALDEWVPARFGEEYVVEARKKGDRVQLVKLKDAGHFEPLVPTTAAYGRVRDAVIAAVRHPKSK